MNIFNLYLDKIKKIVVTANKKKLIEIPENLDGINVDLPPSKFDCDISTNVAMFLSKANKKPPDVIAKKLIELIKKEDNKIENITIVKPGFINIKFKSVFWNEFLEDLIKNNINFGKNDKSKKRNFLIEFVSANPTGPLHVGHCRGAILGDVLSNILLFTNNKVTKEYYVNDYGNQILQFTKSVYLRIREIVFKESFPKDKPDLYPGDYIIDIAKNIISNNKDLKFDDFDKISSLLTKLSVDESLKLVKVNLNNIGVSHDNFYRETDIVNNNEVESVIKAIKDNWNRRLVVAFQPHLYSRTEQFFKEFSESLLLADSVLITEIFASRELDNNSINSQMIVDEMLRLGHQSVMPTTLENLVDDVESVYKKGDIILTIGAGNIWRYSDLIKERLI